MPHTFTRQSYINTYKMMHRYVNVLTLLLSASMGVLCLCNKIIFLKKCVFCISWQPCVVQTPQGHEYEGRSYNGRGVSDVPVLRGLVNFLSSASSGVGISVITLAPLPRLHRSPVCRSCGRGRPWSPPWGPCARTSASARSSSRPTLTQANQR